MQGVYTHSTNTTFTGTLTPNFCAVKARRELLDEISGSGNSYTAEFWQYDSRLGRRWNIDPVDQVSISNYATFRNNPIIFNDPKGDCPVCGLVGGLVDYASQAAVNLAQGQSLGDALLKNIDWADVAISAVVSTVAGPGGALAKFGKAVNTVSLLGQAIVDVNLTNGIEFKTDPGEILFEAGTNFIGGKISSKGGEFIGGFTGKGDQSALMKHVGGAIETWQKNGGNDLSQLHSMQTKLTEGLANSQAVHNFYGEALASLPTNFGVGSFQSAVKSKVDVSFWSHSSTAITQNSETGEFFKYTFTETFTRVGSDVMTNQSLTKESYTPPSNSGNNGVIQKRLD